MKKLILVLLVVFGGVASADDPALKQQEQACYDLLNKDGLPADGEEEAAKKQVREEKSKDNQLDRALELLKSWEVFKAIAQRN